MSKIIMVFASMTGNTKEMADLIAEGVREEEIALEVVEVLDANASDLQEYDGILLGAYTWGDGDLPDEFLDFYDDMDHLLHGLLEAKDADAPVLRLLSLARKRFIHCRKESMRFPC